MGKGRYLAQLNNYPAKDREMLTFICGASEYSYSFDWSIRSPITTSHFQKFEGRLILINTPVLPHHRRSFWTFCPWRRRLAVAFVHHPSLYCKLPVCIHTSGVRICQFVLIRYSLAIYFYDINIYIYTLYTYTLALHFHERFRACCWRHCGLPEMLQQCQTQLLAFRLCGDTPPEFLLAKCVTAVTIGTFFFAYGSGTMKVVSDPHISLVRLALWYWV